MDALRRSTRISKLDRKTNEYIREKMDAPDTILDEITRKQLIWCGHVERIDPTRLPKLWLTGNLKEGKNEAVPEELGKMGYIQLWVKEDEEWANGTTEGNEIWKSEGVARRFKTAYTHTHTHTHTHIYIYIYIYVYLRLVVPSALFL